MQFIRASQYTFAAAASVNLTVAPAHPGAAPSAYNLPTVDPDNVSATIANTGTGAIFVASGGQLITIPPGQALLAVAGDGGLGDAGIGTATTLTIGGTSTVTVTRGTATAQQVFAAR